MTESILRDSTPAWGDTLRMGLVQTPVIPVVGRMVLETPGAISLGQGVVSYGPPPEAVEQISRFLSDPQNHKYKAVQGIPELIEALASKLAAENGIHALPDSSIVVSAGGNMAFMNAVLAIADTGDEIILPTPFYFNHDMAIILAGCRPAPAPTDADYQLVPEAIERAITARTRAVVTVSPNNPSGMVYPEESIRAVNEICSRHGIYHIHDEAYEYFTYDGASHFSPGSIPGSSRYTISLFSLSKSYGFASWRIGYMVIPSHLRETVNKIQDTILICPPVISQFAALGCLEAGRAYCLERLGNIAKVRRQMLAALQSVSDLCDIPVSQGAFYFLLHVHTAMDPMRVVERLIREHGVAVIPGTAFGVSDRCLLRVAYAALEEKTVSEGAGRLVKGLRAIIGEEKHRT